MQKLFLLLSLLLPTTLYSMNEWLNQFDHICGSLDDGTATYQEVEDFCGNRFFNAALAQQFVERFHAHFLGEYHTNGPTENTLAALLLLKNFAERTGVDTAEITGAHEAAYAAIFPQGPKNAFGKFFNFKTTLIFALAGWLMYHFTKKDTKRQAGA